MTLFVVDVDTGITESEIVGIADLAQLHRDLDEIYGDNWFDNIEDAEEALK